MHHKRSPTPRRMMKPAPSRCLGAWNCFLTLRCFAMLFLTSAVGFRDALADVQQPVVAKRDRIDWACDVVRRAQSMNDAFSPAPFFSSVVLLRTPPPLFSRIRRNACGRW